VLVSHRPVLVQGVEKVLVMREGAVEMFGSRADVMKRFLKPAPPAPIPAPAQRVEGRGAQA
jgi:ATP-binding cassette subfamily C protein/ATP-binding cassette subfamily C protein EexD